MNHPVKLLAITLLLLFSASLRAENMIMLRVNYSFDDTMILIKEKMNEYGYTIAHIQKCDSGLSGFGYKIDNYKLIFYGKFEEMRHLTKKYPQIIPYVPLKIAVMQEKDTVLMVAMNPTTLSPFFPDEELKQQFGRWESDIRAFFEEVSEADPVKAPG